VELAAIGLGDCTQKRSAIPLALLLSQGTTGPALLFIHGLGGAKESFYAAFQTAALAHCDLLAFDFPGSGLAEFDAAKCADVRTLAELTHLVWNKLLPRPAFLVAASMGGLIALLLIRRYGTAGVQGLSEIQSELRTSGYPGDHMIAHNMALNTDVRAYYSYSFETVRGSDSGRLLDEFLTMPVPRLFLHGDANKTLSYIPRLRGSAVEVCEVPASAHFLFCDNPVVTYQEIGKFVTKSANPGPV
jgi:pimeloyl-ACP methyl ester carboxylesterase